MGHDGSGMNHQTTRESRACRLQHEGSISQRLFFNSMALTHRARRYSRNGSHAVRSSPLWPSWPRAASAWKPAGEPITVCPSKKGTDLRWCPGIIATGSLEVLNAMQSSITTPKKPSYNVMKRLKWGAAIIPGHHLLPTPSSRRKSPRFKRLVYEKSAHMTEENLGEASGTVWGFQFFGHMTPIDIP